jgi:hypothetical protein
VRAASPTRGVGAKLDAYRLTSPSRELIEQAAQLYGGEVTSWQSPVGPEWQCYTTSEELPVLVMPGYSLQQTYELWEGMTKRTRKCDGVEDDVSGGPCICNAEGVDRCDVYTRLVVALPELDTALGWRLITRGDQRGARAADDDGADRGASGRRGVRPGAHTNRPSAQRRRRADGALRRARARSRALVSRHGGADALTNVSPERPSRPLTSRPISPRRAR